MARDLDVPALLARLGAAPRRIMSDSRRIEAGVAFAAYPGTHADGRLFIADALGRDAAAVLWEARGFQWQTGWRVANLAVDNLRTKLGSIAAFLHGDPSRSLWMIAVTGTNGKTSCSQWIAHALDGCGRRAGVIGTLGNGLVGALAPAPTTTPDAAVLHETLAQFKAAGAVAVTMEVSSIGLDQGRVEGTKFDIALFTNLTRDHLDYHGTMAAYGAAKARLFAWPGLRVAVINADDPFGQGLIDAGRARGQRVLSYGLSNADVAAAGLALAGSGIALTVVTPWGRGEVETRLMGQFNAQNLLGTLAVLLASDVPLTDALAALARLVPPPGRMQRLGGSGRPTVVIDYAHTPDALEKALTALRPALGGAGELVCVFGCGGDRDPGKRPEMGEVAGRLADRVVITSDNPRSEDPAVIASAISHGVRNTGNRRWTIELDRMNAVRAAVGAARRVDFVLLAGKGHEAYQEGNGVRAPYSDVAAADAALAAWSER